MILAHAGAWDRRERLALAICPVTAPGELLGAISLQLSLPHSHGAIGNWIALDSRGHGLATEAARAMIAYAATELGLHRVQGRYRTRNPASRRVL